MTDTDASARSKPSRSWRRALTTCATIIAGALAVFVVGPALFERLAPRRWVRPYQRVTMALYRPTAGIVPGWAVVETIGRNSGQSRQTPVGCGLRGDTLWLVVGDRARSQYVKNIEANPNVRVRVHGRWRTGIAQVVDDDNPRRRLLRMNPVNSLFIWIAGKDLATVRADLQPVSAPVATHVAGPDHQALASHGSLPANVQSDGEGPARHQQHDND